MKPDPNNVYFVNAITQGAIDKQYIPSVEKGIRTQDGVLHEYCTVPDLYEEFHAITVRRQYQSPVLRRLLERSANDMLASGE